MIVKSPIIKKVIKELIQIFKRIFPNLFVNLCKGVETLKVLIAVDETLPLGLKRFIKDDIKVLLQRVYSVALREENKEKIHLVHSAAKYFNFKLSELTTTANT